MRNCSKRLRECHFLSMIMRGIEEMYFLLFTLSNIRGVAQKLAEMGKSGCSKFDKEENCLDGVWTVRVQWDACGVLKEK